MRKLAVASGFNNRDGGYPWFWDAAVRGRTQVIAVAKCLEYCRDILIG